MVTMTNNESSLDSKSFSKAKDLSDVLADSDSDDDNKPISPMVKALRQTNDMSANDMSANDMTDIDEFSQGSSPDSTMSSPSRSFRSTPLRVLADSEALEGSYRGGVLRIEAGVAQRGPRQLKLSSGAGITCTAVPAFLAHADLGGSPSGVLVEAVKPDAPAAEAGLLVGDVILQVNGEGARDHAQVSREIRVRPCSALAAPQSPCSSPRVSPAGRDTAQAGDQGGQARVSRGRRHHKKARL